MESTDNSFAQALGADNPFGDAVIFAPENEEDAVFNALAGKIIDGAVVPVIGPGVLSNGHNLHKELISFLAKVFKVTSCPQSFSELVCDENYLNKNGRDSNSIYPLINKIFAPSSPKQKPSELLRNLMQSKLFPFVITTSFTPVVEDVMREVWGDDLRVLKFNNNPSENDDIGGEIDMFRPTLYYMFGRAGDVRAHRCVVTDQDMLEFCSSWLDESKRPNRLVNMLKNKFLLMLGTDYTDWLFRFIWFSIRKEREKKGEKNDMIARSEFEDSFVHFMQSHETYIMKQDPARVVDNMLEVMQRLYRSDGKLERKLMDRVFTKTSAPMENADVFISYSRSDADFVEALYEALSRRGVNAWYDRTDLTKGGKFMEEIKRAIQTARYFVPVLSHHVAREKNEPHVYRTEWDVACQVATSLGRDYIIPVSEEKFDFYNSSIPEKIQAHNALTFLTIDDADRLAEEIARKIASQQ